MKNILLSLMLVFYLQDVLIISQNAMMSGFMLSTVK